MKRTASLALALAACLAQAQGEQKFGLELATQNVWRGQVFADGWVLNPSFDFGFGPGTHLIAWGSLDLENVGTDEWRFTLMQNFDAVLVDGSVGITRFQRDMGFPDTTEIFAKASIGFPIGATLSIHRDIDAVEGTYFRAGIGGGTPNVGLLGFSAEVSWKAWIGYADDDFAAVYYLGPSGGFADAGFRLQADVGVPMGTASAWAQVTSLVDDDFVSTNGDRTNITFGVGWSMKF